MCLQVQQGTTPTICFTGLTYPFAATGYDVYINGTKATGTGAVSSPGNYATSGPVGIQQFVVEITLTATDTASTGQLFIVATNGANAVATEEIQVVTYDPAVGPTGGTPPTTAQIATAVWEDLLAGGDFLTAGSVGLLLATDINATIGSRSTYAGGAVASVTGAVGSVTGAVGSVTGNVGGNVVGSVGSVVAQVDLVNSPNATALAAIAAAILDASNGVETGITVRHAMRAIGALAGTRTYAGGVLTFTGLDGATVRVTATIASPGNATVVFSLG